MLVKNALLRFYAELNDFLPAPLRQVAFTHEFERTRSVKDAIESLGVPHTEVDLILVDGSPVTFAHRLRDGDRVSVFPVFESFDISSLTRLRSAPLRNPAFVADVHLGRLARYLRMLGFDTAWPGDVPDDRLAEVAVGENRAVLTRDRGLLKRNAVTHGYAVRSKEPSAQIAEVVSRFDLSAGVRPFSRCLRCNGLLREATQEEIERKAPDRVRQDASGFRFCLGCGRLYWRGSHYDAMQRLVASVIESGAGVLEECAGASGDTSDAPPSTGRSGSGQESECEG